MVMKQDCLIFSMYGLVVGRRHYPTVTRKSGLTEALKIFLNIDGEQFYSFGDEEYDLRFSLKVDFDSTTATTEQHVSSNEMGRVWEALECILKTWTRNDFAYSLRVYQAPISLIFMAPTLLLNLKTCLESGGPVGTYFDCSRLS